MKHIVILGSTGSVGTQTLDVVREHKEQFRVIGLSAHTNIDLLKKQIDEFHPVVVCVTNADAAKRLRAEVNQPDILVGTESLLELVRDERVDMVINALVGTVGILPTLTAIEHKKDVAIANKEAIVCAGDLVMSAVKTHGVALLPIDSEPSAIWQCLEGKDPASVRSIILTASGGPFRVTPIDVLPNVGPDEALKHPTWSMGKKITIDSATMMNKGFEVIEAMHLFQISAEQIRIVIHRESIIHSMVEFCDGSLLAQLSITYMHIPIQYALCYPQRMPFPHTCSLELLQSLTFEKWDKERYPCISLAYEAAQIGGTMPAVLNAANDVLVSRFLSKDIYFTDIADGVSHAMKHHQSVSNPSLEDIFGAIAWAQEFMRAH